MALLPIYETPDPMLRQISTPVEKVDDDLRALIADMFETMYAAPGIGLAAVQVGVPKRLLVMDLQEPEDPETRKASRSGSHGFSSTPRYCRTATTRCLTLRDACRCRTNMPR
jgi:peptide deformylase